MRIVLPNSTHVPNSLSLCVRARFTYVHATRERERERESEREGEIHTHTHTHTHTGTGVCEFTISCIPQHKCDTSSFAYTLYIDIIGQRVFQGACVYVYMCVCVVRVCVGDIYICTRERVCVCTCDRDHVFARFLTIVHTGIDIRHRCIRGAAPHWVCLRLT